MSAINFGSGSSTGANVEDILAKVHKHANKIIIDEFNLTNNMLTYKDQQILTNTSNFTLPASRIVEEANKKFVSDVEKNALAGINTNIKSQLDLLSGLVNGSMKFKGKFNNYASMVAAIPNPTIGDTVSIDNDEKVNGNKTIYVYQNNAWQLAFNSQLSSGWIASSTEPTDKTLLWLDTSNATVTIKWFNGTAWINIIGGGEDGKSAYDIWLEQNNTGTVDEFLTSLIGPQGSTGSDGNSIKLRRTDSAIEWKQVPHKILTADYHAAKSRVTIKSSDIIDKIVINSFPEEAKFAKIETVSFFGSNAEGEYIMSRNPSINTTPAGTTYPEFGGFDPMTSAEVNLLLNPEIIGNASIKEIIASNLPSLIETNSEITQINRIDFWVHFYDEAKEEINHTIASCHIMNTDTEVENEWEELISISELSDSKGIPGSDARDILLRKTDSNIEWSYKSNIGINADLKSKMAASNVYNTDIIDYIMLYNVPSDTEFVQVKTITICGADAEGNDLITTNPSSSSPAGTKFEWFGKLDPTLGQIALPINKKLPGDMNIKTVIDHYLAEFETTHPEVKKISAIKIWIHSFNEQKEELFESMVTLNISSVDNSWNALAALSDITGPVGPQGAVGPQGPVGPVGPVGPAPNVDNLATKVELQESINNIQSTSHEHANKAVIDKLTSVDTDILFNSKKLATQEYVEQVLGTGGAVITESPDDGSICMKKADGTIVQIGVTLNKFNELEQRLAALESKLE